MIVFAALALSIATSLPPIDVVPQPRFVRALPCAYHTSRGARANVQFSSPPVSGGPEAYRLSIDERGIRIMGTHAGTFYALQTLSQMTVRAHGERWIRCADITDWPQYRWRGIQLDVARHFFTSSVVKRFIDVAAHYKLNIFHWHLTDDQGWTLPVGSLPRLTAHRPHYTPAQIREVIAYASRRYVTVVPEIDMPSHAGAALSAYRSYSCGEDTSCEDAPSIAFWKQILGEAMALFPGQYVHVGGDEVPHPLAALQPRFTDGIERFVESRGRRIVGWDEILNPRLGTGAAIMVWQSPALVAAAASRGNPTIVAHAPLYFDAVQGDAAQEPRGTRHMATLEQVYDFDIKPAGLGQAAQQLLGGEAQLWTEHISTPEQLFYMALPRELALSEVLWTAHQRKGWEGFYARLPAQLTWLASRDYTFRLPAPRIVIGGARLAFSSLAGRTQSVNAATAGSRVHVAFDDAMPNATLRYTLDGSAPTPRAPRYGSGFTLRLTQYRTIPLAVAAFWHGRRSSISACNLTRIPASKIVWRGASNSWSSIASP